MLLVLNCGPHPHVPKEKIQILLNQSHIHRKINKIKNKNKIFFPHMLLPVKNVKMVLFNAQSHKKIHKIKNKNKNFFHINFPNEKC